jgi:glucosylceramidase
MNRGRVLASIISTCCAVLLTACEVAPPNKPIVKAPAVKPPVACITSAQNGYWKTTTFAEATGDAVDLTISDANAAQTWEGFGGSFNEAGWALLTTKALQDEAIEACFGEEGCRFTWGRIPIGASDYALERYTLDETPDDYTMSKFSIERDKKYLLPYVKAAQAVKPDLKFWASPWTPPTWMKVAPFQPRAKSNYDGGKIKADEPTFKALALYLTKFVQEYEKQGIKVEVVSPQNEPNYEQNYPSCRWNAQQFTSFLPYLDSSLKGAKLDTKIMLGTMSNPQGDLQIIQAVAGNPDTKKLVSMVGVQWGVADQLTRAGNAVAATGLPIWLTEHRCGNYPNGQGTNWNLAPNNHAYAKDSWGYMTKAIKGGVTSYSAWNLVLDKVGHGNDTDRMWAQNALMVVDEGKLIRTPCYYVFRHLCQYVDPGAKVLQTASNDVLAFKNPDGSMVAVVYSAQGKSDYSISMKGKKIKFAMPQDGWATVVVN